MGVSDAEVHLLNNYFLQDCGLMLTVMAWKKSRRQECLRYWGRLAIYVLFAAWRVCTQERLRAYVLRGFQGGGSRRAGMCGWPANIFVRVSKLGVAVRLTYGGGEDEIHAADLCR
jgi:hypothetical protein